MNEMYLVIDEKLFAEIDKTTYRDMIKNPESIIKLKDKKFANEVISKITKGAK